MGTKADESAPSANKSRVRLGMRKPSRNASYTKPAPNSRAMTISRSSPVMRDMAIATETIPADRTTLSDGAGLSILVAKFRLTRHRAGLLSQFFEKVRDGHNAGVIIANLVLFVGRMQAVVGQAEAHQNRGNVQMPGEVANHWNGTPVAREHSGLAEHIAERLSRNSDERVIGINHHRRGRAQYSQLDADALRRVVLQELAEQLEDLVGILIRNQSKANFGDSLGRDDGLRSGSGKSARDAVNLDRRPRPDALQHRVARFAGQSASAHFAAQEFRLVKRKALPAFALHGSWRRDIIVHTRNSDETGRVFTFAQQLHEAEDRVGRRAAVEPGVQIAIGTGGFHFHIDQAAQADAQGRQAFGVK